MSEQALAQQLGLVVPSMLEVRAFALRDLRIEGRSEGEQRRIEGYAAVFDVPSDPLMEWEGGRLIERVERGAFTKTLREADIRALINHNPSLILGRNKAKTLSLAEDERGLKVVILPPDTQFARDLEVSMERGDIDQMSFLFRITKAFVERAKDETTGVTTYTRYLREVRLFDVSVVTFPAYPDTDAQVRSLLQDPETPDDLREHLEPAQARHSGEDGAEGREGGEPVQEDHSAAERARWLELTRHTL